jgi:hypothetical protein
VRTTIHISIGNSDNKLTQEEWAAFVADAEYAISNTEREGIIVHGRWFSLPDSVFQNACWALETSPETKHTAIGLASLLQEMAAHYQQDAIAWTEGRTLFIQPNRRLSVLDS